MRITFEGRVAVVTGAGRGIGETTAVAFAESGAAVAVWELDEESGRATADRIRRAGGRATFVHVDCGDRTQVDAAVAETLAEHGRIDVLINNAGILRDAQLVKVSGGEIVDRMSEADFDAVIAVNLKGVFHCTQAVVPAMIEQRYGRIVSASSVVGLYGNFGQTNYVASKAGVIGMTRVWARELGRHGITANAIAPGFIETEMARSVPDKLLEGIIAHTPVGRLGQPGEIARAYLFLASEHAGYITGAVLSVDGGLVTGT